MKKRSRTSLASAASAAAAFALATGGCGPHAVTPVPGPDPAAFDGARAFAGARDLLALGARDAGTPGAAKAAAHLADRFGALGLEVATDTFEEVTPQGPMTFRNVIARRGDGNRIILFAAHYDTKSGIPGFQGANDSGSGVGVTLELARLVAAAPAAPAGASWWFALLDGEECRVEYGAHDGLHGSRRLARRLVEQGIAPRVKAVIVLDMVGDRDLTLTIPRNGTPDLVAAALEAAGVEKVREKTSLSLGGVLDDHVPFMDAGMPAVDLIDFCYGSAPGLNDYWHTANDTLEHISPESLATSGRIAIRVAQAALAAP